MTIRKQEGKQEELEYLPCPTLRRRRERFGASIKNGGRVHSKVSSHPREVPLG